MVNPTYSSSVFINCPYDDEYWELLDAIIFCVFDCGFTPRCAMEIDDGTQIRLDKIFKIIEECKFSIHDISRTELNPTTNLPRFNVPLELGMFFGAKRFGSAKQKQKSCIILDVEQYRYQHFISDIAGQDIKAHEGTARCIIRLIRDYLNSHSKRVTIPGGADIWQRYQEYLADLPALCAAARITLNELTFNDKATFASEWLRERG